MGGVLCWRQDLLPPHSGEGRCSSCQSSPELGPGEETTRSVLLRGWLVIAAGFGPGQKADGVHLPTGCSADGCWETDPAPAVCDRDVTCAYERICWTLWWAAGGMMGAQPNSEPHVALSFKCWCLSSLSWHFFSLLLYKLRNQLTGLGKKEPHSCCFNVPVTGDKSSPQLMPTFHDKNYV